MRILNRYLKKEIFYSMITVTSVMVFIFVCNRLVRFLQFLAQGKYGPGFLTHLVLLQVPILFGLFLPLGLFLGILLSYGRLYADSEMTVMLACGMSRRQLLRITMKITAAVAVVVAILVFFINPYISARQDKLLDIIRTKTVFQTILPGQFQASNQGQKVFYIKSMSSDRSELNGLFVAEQLPPQPLPKSKTKSGAPTLSLPAWTVLYAKSGYQKVDLKTNAHFMVAVNGYRYKGVPGEKNFETTKFQQYGFHLPTPDLSKLTLKASSLPSWELLKLAWFNRQDMAELQWRLSMPLTALILGLLAVPLSRVKPRHGRFARVWLAILIYIVYANMLFITRDWVADGTIPAWLGMWWVHLILFIVAFKLFKKFEHEIN
jgi:lipopolysaccharide export system permease protein